MSLIIIPNTFTVGAVIIASQHNSNFSTIYSDYNGNIQDANIAANADISDSKLSQIITAGKVSGASFISLSSIPSGSGIVPTANLGSGTSTNGTVLINGAWGYFPYIKCSNVQSQNTSGGTATSGGWNQIVLNTKDNDTASIATLSSNKITLPSGNYLVRGFCPFNITNISQIRLFNNTDSSVILIGTPSYANSGAGVGSVSHLNGYFTIASSKDLYFQYQVQTTVNTSGLGSPGNYGQEVYATIEFTKIG